MGGWALKSSRLSACFVSKDTDLGSVVKLPAMNCRFADLPT